MLILQPLYQNVLFPKFFSKSPSSRFIVNYPVIFQIYRVSIVSDWVIFISNHHGASEKESLEQFSEFNLAT